MESLFEKGYRHDRKECRRSATKMIEGLSNLGHDEKAKKNRINIF